MRDIVGLVMMGALLGVGIWSTLVAALVLIGLPAYLMARKLMTSKAKS